MQHHRRMVRHSMKSQDSARPNVSLGKTVYRHRQKLGLGLREFAAKAKVDHTMVLRLERGGDIRLSSFVALVKKHQIPVSF